MHEVQVLSDRQQMFKSTMKDKLRLQSRATEKYHDQIFEEIQELEEKILEEAMLIVQKKDDYGDIRMRGMQQEGC